MRAGLAAVWLSCPVEDIAGPGLAIDQTAHLKKGASGVIIAVLNFGLAHRPFHGLAYLSWPLPACAFLGFYGLSEGAGRAG